MKEFFGIHHFQDIIAECSAVYPSEEEAARKAYFQSYNLAGQWSFDPYFLPPVERFRQEIQDLRNSLTDPPDIA